MIADFFLFLSSVIDISLPLFNCILMLDLFIVFCFGPYFNFVLSVSRLLNVFGPFLSFPLPWIYSEPTSPYSHSPDRAWSVNFGTCSRSVRIHERISESLGAVNTFDMTGINSFSLSRLHSQLTITGISDESFVIFFRSFEHSNGLQGFFSKKSTKSTLYGQTF